MNAIIIFGPGFKKATAVIASRFRHASPAIKIISGNSTKRLHIHDGCYSPCMLHFAHYSLAGGDFELWGKRLLEGMSFPLMTLNDPSLDWFCDTTSMAVGLIMCWDRCDASTVQKTAKALEDSFIKQGGSMAPKKWWEFWKKGC